MSSNDVTTDDVLELQQDGFTTSDIAARLGISRIQVRLALRDASTDKPSYGESVDLGNIVSQKAAANAAVAAAKRLQH